MTLPAAIMAALDALEATNPSYSAGAAKARADVERAIKEELVRAFACPVAVLPPGLDVPSTVISAVTI